jgi:phosphatidylglycerol lysyltransferase
MENEQIKELLKKYGYNTVSFETLMGGLEYFESNKGIEGYIAYLNADNVCLAAGDPICSEETFIEFVHEFRNFCKSKASDCCFLSVSSGAFKYFDLMGFGSIKIGEEGIFDLSNYSFEGGKMKSARQSANHAKNKGVKIAKLEEKDEKTFDEIKKLSKDWLKTRKTTGFSFLLTLNPLENFEDKLFFVAQHNNKIVGYLSCVPIYARNGYYFEDLIRDKEAPYGTNYLLIYEAITYLKEKGFKLATLGTSPLGNIEKTDNQDFKNVNKAFNFIYNNINGFYNFKGLHEFKSNFNPTFWEDKYFCFYPPKIKPRMILAVIKAYNPTGIPGLLFSKLKKILFILRE